uniref:DED domain-containing protein n=1 Tax=Taeniopygia guttata TaxID=59729 RepID=A0A674GUY3_TAEGU
MWRRWAGWEEEECLEFYGMLSLHRLFEVLAAQLTPSDVAVLSFLLDEALGDAERDKDGDTLLLELERRGLCHEGDLGQLRQLLRLLARHDLLRCVTLKRPRPGEWHGWLIPSVPPVSPLTVSPVPPVPPVPPSTPQCPQCPSSVPPDSVPCPPSVPPVSPHGSNWFFLVSDIRLRVRAEYCEHDRALRRGVASSRPRGPGRALDVFGQASGVLKARDLGSILCDIKFSELSYLEAFWGDYLSGALLEALKGVFLTEGLRRAVGREDVRLLVSVDQDDYEAGRRLLLQERTPKR